MARVADARVVGRCAFIPVGSSEIIIDDSDLPRLRSVQVSFGRNATTAFAYVRFDNGGTTRLGRFLMRPAAGQVVDHINGNPLDNRRSNLRVVTSQANNRNRAKAKGPYSSKFKGVSHIRGKWKAVIYKDYRQKYLGTFDTQEEAARAYDAAARDLFGQHAALNFPKVGEQSAHRPRTVSFHASNDTQEA